VKFSALVLTYNESRHIRACLDSLASARRIVVIDSGSTDGTRAILRASGSRVECLDRPFESFSAQRSFGLRTAFEPGEWVLHLDADERLTPRLAREIGRLRPARGAVAFNIASLTHFRGRAIPRSSGFPAYQTRLTRAGAFEFVEIGHGQKAPPELGELPRLRAPYHHHPFENGFAAWRTRHERYSDREAAEFLASRGRYTLAQALRDPIARRQWCKQASRRLPFRAACICAWLMVVRGGVLEGPEGRAYCRLRFLYESMIDEKVRRPGR
jgi:glycosyltransferase involved in cell wall biosynthesis